MSVTIDERELLEGLVERLTTDRTALLRACEAALRLLSESDDPAVGPRVRDRGHPGAGYPTGEVRAMKPFWPGMFFHDVTLFKALRTTSAIGGSRPSYPTEGVAIRASVQKSTVGRTDSGGRIYSDTKHTIHTPEEPGSMAGVAEVTTGDKFMWKGHTLIADGHAEPNGIERDVDWITACTETR